MGTSGNAAHGALNSPLLLVLVTVALLAGSAYGARELTSFPSFAPQTVSLTNSLTAPAVVTVTTTVFGFSPFIVTVTVNPGQVVPVQLPLNVFAGTYSISVAVGGQVYVVAPTLAQQLLGDAVGLSLGLSVCVNLPGLLVTVTVFDKPATSTCVAPPNPSPPPPSPSPPPPTASPPPPPPSPPPPAHSPPPPSPPPPSPSPPPPSPPPPSPSPPPPSPPPPSPPPPSPSPPPPSPPPPSPSPPPPPPHTSPPPPPHSPPPPSPPAPSPSPPPPSPATHSSPPPPALAEIVIELNITNLLSVNITIIVTTTAPNGVVTVFTSVVIDDGSVLIIVYPVGSKITDITITAGVNGTVDLSADVVADINDILSSSDVVQIQTSPCTGGIDVKAAATLLELATANVDVCLDINL